MGFFDLFKKKYKKPIQENLEQDKTEPLLEKGEEEATRKNQKLSEENLKWDKMWALWVDGKAESPYAELMTYDGEVNNGGHSQFFYNVANTSDLPKTIDVLYTVLPDALKDNLKRAYEAYLKLEDDSDEAGKILAESDLTFYHNESELEKVLKTYSNRLTLEE